MSERAADRVSQKPAGSVLFTGANILTLLFGLGHAGGVLQTGLMLRRPAGAQREPQLEQLRDLFARLDAYQTPELLGFQASMLDLRSFFNIAFSVLLMAMFAGNIAALRSAADPRAALTRLSLVHACSMFALAALSLKFNIAQGIVTATLIAILFLLAALRAKLALPTIRSSAA